MKLIAFSDLLRPAPYIEWVNILVFFKKVADLLWATTWTTQNWGTA